MSEGIGDSALEVIWERGERADFLRDELYSAARLPEVDAGLQMQIEQAGEGLRGVSGNAALLLHRDGRPAEEVQRYLERWGLRTPHEAAQSMKFLQSPLFRSYTFNYAMGKDLLKPLLEGPAAVGNYRRLLSEPFTPSQVRRWVEQEK